VLRFVAVNARTSLRVNMSILPARSPFPTSASSSCAAARRPDRPRTVRTTAASRSMNYLSTKESIFRVALCKLIESCRERHSRERETLRFESEQRERSRASDSNPKAIWRAISKLLNSRYRDTAYLGKDLTRRLNIY